jgi:cytochrome c oxidase subunit 1
MTAVRLTLPKNYLNQDYTLWSWLTTLDHKRIAWLYLVSIAFFFFFFFGGAAATAIRLELATAPGDLVDTEAYNRLFSLHGIAMVWFFLVPSIPSTMGNFLIPLMIGARDLAFPRLNLLSWYLYVIAGIFVLAMVITGGVDTGWTFYTPLYVDSCLHKRQNPRPIIGRETGKPYPP